MYRICTIHGEGLKHPLQNYSLMHIFNLNVEWVKPQPTKSSDPGEMGSAKSMLWRVKFSRLE